MRIARSAAACLVAAFAFALSPARAPAQESSDNALQRAQRFQQLQQMQIDQRIRVNQSIPADQRLLIDYGGYFTFDYLSLDDSSNNNHGLRDYDLVTYLRLNFDNANEVFLRSVTDYHDFNPGDSFDGYGSRLINPDLDRAYYRFDIGKALAGYTGKVSNNDLIIQGGRDFVYWANGLVLAQVLDGGKLDFTAGPLALEIIGGVTPTRTVDFDSSRPAYDHNTRRGFYGALLSAQVADHRPFIYGLVQRDYNNSGPYAEQITGPIDTRYSYNSDYLGFGSTGSITDKLSYGAEFAWEFGNDLSNSFMASGLSLIPVSQTRDYINAYAWDFQLNYLAEATHQTRLSAEMIAASGDADRGTTSNTFDGNTPGTPDNAFNAFGLLNTGLAFAPNVSNIMAFRLGAATLPLPHVVALRRLQAGTDLFLFSKFQRNAPIDESTKDRSWLGIEPDVYVNWDITSDVTLALRYGVFFPDSRAFPSDKVRQFVYAGITFAF
jgi:hypothetical protein